MSCDAPKPSAALVELGGLLHRLRVNAGLTGIEMSERIHLSQSAISKLETGKAGLPEQNRVAEILLVTAATKEQADHVRRQYELAQMDPQSYIRIEAEGVDRKQHQFIVLEQYARTVRDFQNSVIPGLLQTPQYAAAVFAKLGMDSDALTRAVHERGYRQAILNDPRRQFTFVIQDAALYSVHGDVDDHIEQLRYVLNRATARNIVVRVLDSKQGLPLSTANPFTIIDRRYVSAETTICELTTSQPLEVHAYETAFQELINISQDELAARDEIQAAIMQLLERG